jgi:hypothetical protein
MRHDELADSALIDDPQHEGQRRVWRPIIPLDIAVSSNKREQLAYHRHWQFDERGSRKALPHRRHNGRCTIPWQGR